MDCVSKFDNLDHVAIVGVLDFAFFSFSFCVRLLLFNLGTTLNLPIQAEILLDVQEYLLELAELVAGLIVLGLQRLHFLIDLLSILTFLAFVFFQTEGLALLG